MSEDNYPAQCSPPKAKKPRRSNKASEKSYKPYWQKLKDPRWQKKRLKVLERAGYTCEWCERGINDDDPPTMHVHHTYYEKGADPWDYPDSALLCLCEGCHAKATDLTMDLQRSLGVVGRHESELLQIIGYAKALAAQIDGDGGDGPLQIVCRDVMEVDGVGDLFGLGLRMIEGYFWDRRKGECEYVGEYHELEEIARKVRALRRVFEPWTVDDLQRVFDGLQ